MKKIIIILIILLMSACTRGSTASTDEQGRITVSQAEDIAIELVGGGNMQSLETNIIDDNIQFIISIYYNGGNYDVVLDAKNGNLISLSLVSQYEEYEEDLNITPNYPPHEP